MFLNVKCKNCFRDVEFNTHTHDVFEGGTYFTETCPECGATLDMDVEIHTRVVAKSEEYDV
jgi:hypothetical protein